MLFHTQPRGPRAPLCDAKYVSFPEEMLSSSAGCFDLYTKPTCIFFQSLHSGTGQDANSSKTLPCLSPRLDAEARRGPAAFWHVRKQFQLQDPNGGKWPETPDESRTRNQNVNPGSGWQDKANQGSRSQVPTELPFMKPLRHHRLLLRMRIYSSTGMVLHSSQKSIILPPLSLLFCPLLPNTFLPGNPGQRAKLKMAQTFPLDGSAFRQDMGGLPGLLLAPSLRCKTTTVASSPQSTCHGTIQCGVSQEEMSTAVGLVLL